MKFFTRVFICFFFLTSVALADIVNIPDDFDTISQGILEAADGDTILIAEGEYNENLDLSDRILTLASLYLINQDPEVVENTIIDGSDGDGRSVIRAASEEGGGQCTIIGLTLRGGDTDYGGGMYVRNQEAYLDHILFYENTVSNGGGGLYVTRGASVVGNGCSFDSNQAQSYSAHFAVYNDSELELSNCILLSQGERNSDLRVHSSNLILRNIDLGSIGITATSSDFVSPQLVLDNVKLDSDIHISGLEDAFSNISIYGCEISSYLEFESCETIIQRSIIGDIELEGILHLNHVTKPYGRIYIDDNSQLDITNSILFSDVSEIASNGFNEEILVSISYSDIEGGQDGLDLSDNVTLNWGPGNIDADPMFTEVADHNYILSTGSPCIDTGDPNEEMDGDRTRTDMGAIEYPPAYLYGYITTEGDNEPVEDVIIHSNRDGFGYSDEEGRYLFRTTELGMHDLDFQAPGHTDYVMRDVNFSYGSELYEEITVDPLVLHVDTERIHVELDENDEEPRQVVIRNECDNEFNWNLEKRTHPNDGARAWIRRFSFDIENDDDRSWVTAADKFGDYYYVVNCNYSSIHFIQKYNEDGSLVDQNFLFDGTPDHRVRDLVFMDNHIWTVFESTLYQINLDLQIVNQQRINLGDISSITWNPSDEVFLVAMGGARSRIYELNGDGEFTGNQHRNPGFPILSLSYFEGTDPQFPLHIMTDHFNVNRYELYRMNLENNNTQLLCHSEDLIESQWTLRSMAITPDFDGEKPAHLVVSYVTSETDSLAVIEFLPATHWFTILGDLSGDLNPDEEHVIELMFNSYNPLGTLVRGYLAVQYDDAQIETLVQLSMDVTLDVDDQDELVPQKFSVSSPFPNPFNAISSVNVKLPVASNINLYLYDLSGRLVKTAEHGNLQAGEHRLSIDGNALGSGVYLLKTTAGEFEDRKKVVLVR